MGVKPGKTSHYPPYSQLKKDEVVKEFAPVGKYRVRILETKNKKLVLDIREYLATDRFEGFTRRGVRLEDVTQVELLEDILRTVKGDMKRG